MTAHCVVSIVIPCFNHGKFLPEAVASVTSVARADVELIVVDDGSTDERTHAEMQALLERGITVLRQTNQGLAAARNAGIRASRGQYVLPLDADNRLRSGYFDNGIRILSAQPSVGVVYGDAQYFGKRSGRWRVGAFHADWLLRTNYIDACAMYRRSIWEQNGGYDGAMPVQGEEDWDFWLSTLEHGWEFAYVPEVLFDYRVSEESMITRSVGARAELDRFIATKHALLYRRRSIELAKEKSSIRATSGNLYRLLKRNLRQMLSNGNPK